MKELTELAKAVIAVMKEVRGMEKNARVGTGSGSYDGTRDQDVKEVFNDALARNGLCIIPIEVIEESTQIDRWEDEKYNTIRQSVFTKVKMKYLLLHESGQSIELAGYGHGVDPQDKGAGKATTYALKNCLLYTFLTPVGKIDDTGTKHSNKISIPMPSKTEKPLLVTEVNKKYQQLVDIYAAKNGQDRFDFFAKTKPFGIANDKDLMEFDRSNEKKAAAMLDAMLVQLKK